MTWSELLGWVQDPQRTIKELRQACDGLELSRRGGRDDIVSRLSGHIRVQSDMNAQASWQPPTAQPPERPIPWGWIPFGAIAGILLALLLVGSIVGVRWAVHRWSANGGSGLETAITGTGQTAAPAEAETSGSRCGNVSVVCGCGQQLLPSGACVPIVATPTPTPTPASSAPTVKVVLPCEDHELKSGEEYVVAKGCSCNGDIEVWTNDWLKLYDSDGATGLVTSFCEDTKVRAPWGANCGPYDAEVFKKQQEATGLRSIVKYWPEGCKIQPSATPTASVATPTVVVSASAKDPCQKNLVSGEEFLVPKGCNVSGDIQVWSNGQWESLYDNSAESGLIVSFKQDTKIRAPWGAYVGSESVDTMKVRLQAGGCGLPNGCKSIEVKTWPK